MSETIKKGDTVNVYWYAFNAMDDRSFSNCTVVSLSDHDGDYWQLLKQDGTPINVGRFDLMERVNK